MALQATLKLEGKSYDVQDLNYELYKPYDNNYKPSAAPQGGTVNFTILSPMDTNLVFHDWLLNSEQIVKSGIFLLPLTHGIKHVEKELKFELAHCVRVQEYYSNGASQMYLQITISATVIKFGPGVEFRNRDFPG